VVLTASDSPFVDAQAQVTLGLLRSLGIKADLQASDSGTHSVRRASRKPVGEGGWNIFFSWFPAPTVWNPAVNIPLRSTGNSASWPGWPNIPELEALRDQWLTAESEELRHQIAARIEAVALTEVPFIVTGQFSIARAYRTSLDGVISGPYPFLWNIRKS
jgi:peptide/nickel transport system substrate-binding protein